MGSRLRAVDAAGIERITEDYRRATDAGGGGGLRQHRGARRAQLPPQRVLEPQAQPPRRPVRWLGREPRPLRPHRPAHRARRRRTERGGDRQAQHGRRRRRRPVARRERRGRPALRGRRRARCARAHRGQLAGQSDVPLPGRCAAPGVRRHAAGRRSGSASASSATASCAPTPTRRPSSSPTRGSSGAALSTPLILLGGITELPTIEMALAEGFAFVAMARALLREPDLPNRMQADAATTSLCIHCNKCMPTIYSGTRCVLVSSTARCRLRRDRRPAAGPRGRLLPAGRPARAASPRRRSARRTARRWAARRRSSAAAAKCRAGPSR